MKDGKLIPPEIWFAPSMRERLEAEHGKFSEGMTELMNICDEEGFTRPTAVKSAVIVSTGEAFTKYALPAFWIQSVHTSNARFGS
jgi:hypothetical protein